MKKLSIEEKAKAYDEAVNRMKHYVVDKYGCSRIQVSDVFPELKESEDERIRKEMIEILKKEANDFPSSVIAEKSNSWIDYLERQRPINPTMIEKERIDNAFTKMMLKEQKPAKDEPKFHKGEWVVFECGEKSTTLQISRIIEGTYEFTDDSFLDVAAEDSLHLWTINDAKDGDVLASGEVVFVFKVIHGVWLNCHYSAHKDGSFNADSYDLLKDKYFGEVYPATKEQRDFLFQKMKEAGYEWDAKKKVLKELGIFYCNEHCKGYRDTGGKCFFGFDCPSRREAKQKLIHQEVTKIND